MFSTEVDHGVGTVLHELRSKAEENIAVKAASVAKAHPLIAVELVQSRQDLARLFEGRIVKPAVRM